MSDQVARPEFDTAEALGLWLGYPMCCVNYFYKRMVHFKTGIPIKDVVHQELDGTGYVPCEACSQLPADTLVERIQSARQCAIAFPDYD